MELKRKYQIAQSAGSSASMLSHVINGRCRTTNPSLALAAAKLTGKLPVEFVSKKYKALLLKAHPELNKVITKSHKRNVVVRR